MVLRFGPFVIPVELAGQTRPRLTVTADLRAVSIDGWPESNVDLYAPARVDNVRVFGSATLPAGNHTLQVRVTGTRNAASTGTSVPADQVDTYP